MGLPGRFLTAPQRPRGRERDEGLGGAPRALSGLCEVFLFVSAYRDGQPPLPRFPHLTDISSAPSVCQAVPGGGGAEINVTAVPSRASQSDS